MNGALALPIPRPVALPGLKPLRRLRAIVLAFATLLVDGEKAIRTNLVSGLGGTVPQYGAWGTGAGTTAHGDTTLFTEDSGGSPAYARVAATITRITTTLTNDTISFVYTITANASKTITNAGLFDAATSGNLFLKTDFTGLALSSGDSLTFTLKAIYS